MDYPLIANILLAVASFFTLAAMLRWDALCMQQHEYSNKQFMQWLQHTDESYSTKRIVAMAALVASATSWARESWMVVAIVALTMLVLAVVTLRLKHESKARLSKRSVAIIIAVLAIAAACAASLITAHFSLEAGMMLMLFTAFSYALAMGVNIISQIVKKNNNKQ